MPQAGQGQSLYFYILMFSYRELGASRQRRKQGKANRFAGDGWTNLAIYPFYSPSEGHEARYGVNHFGFIVLDLVRKVDEFAREIPVAKRLDSRPHRVHDRKANMFDLSQTKGWKVDVDK